MRIVATRAAIGPEPRDPFAVDEDRVNVIRPQPTGSILESEMLDLASIAIDEHSPRVGARPDVSARVRAERRDCAGACADLFGMRQIAGVEKSAVFGRRLRAKPQMPARFGVDGFDEERARPA